jgi:hypothetical protein
MMTMTEVKEAVQATVNHSIYNTTNNINNNIKQAAISRQITGHLRLRIGSTIVPSKTLLCCTNTTWQKRRHTVLPTRLQPPSHQTMHNDTWTKVKRL